MSKATKTEEFATFPAVTVEQRHTLVLRAWEAINTERELGSVLATVADVLVPVIAMESISVVVFDQSQPPPFAMHTVGLSSNDNAKHEVMLREGRVPVAASTTAHKRIPYENSDMKLRHHAGLPYLCADLLEKEYWFDHEFRLASLGIRAYANFPLSVRGKQIGVVVFNRTQPVAFSSDELEVLSDLSRAMAIAVENAVAWQEIRTLRDQLEAENITLRTQLGQAPWFNDIIGDSPALRRVLEAVEQVAPTDATVLIAGETGTGKELIARAIHRRSGRAHGPLVKVNCAALPETLLGSELFGHERGAFTGAIERRKGRFEQAHRGTLFLDEIGELPQEMQVLLLRVLQEREIERLGGNQTIPVDLRIVAATNRNLAEDMRTGRFRSDLYYRLVVFPIQLPSLRERPEDISPLAAHFADKHGARFNRPIARIDRQSMKWLEAYHWPGNVRELENVIERAVILSRNGTLKIDRAALPGQSLTGDMNTQLETQERETIEATLRTTRGRIAGANGAAKRLGLSPSTLEFRIKRLGIDKFRFRNSSL